LVERSGNALPRCPSLTLLRRNQSEIGVDARDWSGDD
jgi:hypothetical protein